MNPDRAYAPEPSSRNSLSPENGPSGALVVFPTNFFLLDVCLTKHFAPKRPSRLSIIPKESRETCFSPVYKTAKRRPDTFSLFLYASFYCF